MFVTQIDAEPNFEQNVNAVGENIAQAEMLGNKELVLIQRHLESLEEKKQLADRFLDTSNEELQSIFQQQGKLVKVIFENYHQQLEDERNELSSFVRETLQIISKKKTDLLNHLENAFDVSRVNTMFSHLKTLPEIAEKLSEVEQAIIKENELSKHFETLLSNIAQLEAGLNAASALQVKTMTAERSILSADIKGATTLYQETVANTLQEVSHQNRLLVESGTEKTAESLEEVKSNLDALHSEVEKSSKELLSHVDDANSAVRQVQKDIADLGINVGKGAVAVRTVIENQAMKVETLIQNTSKQEKREIIEALATTGKNNVELVVDGVNDSVKKTLGDILSGISKANE